MDFESDGFVDAKRLLWEANFKTKFVDFESDGFVGAKHHKTCGVLWAAEPFGPSGPSTNMLFESDGFVHAKRLL